MWDEFAQSIGFELVDEGASGKYFELEIADSGSYDPLFFQSGVIRSTAVDEPYGGDTRADYYLIIEEYGTEEEAQKRVDEYLDYDRLAELTGEDSNALSKMTLRCWGLLDKKRVYLLTTRAAKFATLERENGLVKKGLISALQ